MAAARSAAAAPYPAPASHPPAGQPKRNFLPRVAGLSRRGQTPLARPVPNKKALPHPQESPSAAVLGSANPSTSSNGETGELVAQIGQAHGQRRGEVHHSSDGCQCRGAPTERRFLSTQKHEQSCHPYH
ncbi:uncharacterized protein LOC121405447 isoform X3 [Drosophila obscura]|uniref:uncharacterized protein LOC121405447 isoform X3 n=1 Tax=Drosophila obscura TaxID=7282 RepID=UPI001BB28038|nr:uncharacterized protein LOC121405447 isoform X3 [Drosophila obscura]